MQMAIGSCETSALAPFGIWTTSYQRPLPATESASLAMQDGRSTRPSYLPLAPPQHPAATPHHHLLLLHVQHHLTALPELSRHQELRQRILEEPLHRPTQRPGAVGHVGAPGDDQLLQPLCPAHHEACVPPALQRVLLEGVHRPTFRVREQQLDL